MDRGTAGTSSKFTTSGSDYNQSDDAASPSSVQSKRGLVRQLDNSPRTTPKINESHNTSGACSSTYLPCRSISPAQPFNDLINQEKFDEIAIKSHHFGDCYDGRNHGQHADSIKRYTLASKRPLNPYEQSQLIPLLLKNFQPTRSWNWRSLTTILHSLTSAGVFAPHKLTGKNVKRTQADLLSTLLAPTIFKCNQKPEASNIDARGVANLLWAIAKLVDNGQEWTPELKEAVAALLPHVYVQKDQFIPQHIANLLWAIGKLVDYGQKQTPKVKEAVAALLPQVNAQIAQFVPQNIANLLWAMAKLLDNGHEWTPELKEAVDVLLPQVKVRRNQFIPQHIANLLWAIAKLVENGHEWTPELKQAQASLLPRVNAQKSNFKPQEITILLWAIAKLMDNGQKLTPEIKEAVTVLLPCVRTHKDQFDPQNIANLLWAMAEIVEYGQVWTPEFKVAVAELLPRVNAQKANFKPLEISSLLWAIAKLVDNGQERTLVLKEAVSALLPYVKVKAQKANFKSQEITILLWAMAKLVEYGQEQAPELKEAVAALLPRLKVKAQKANFKPKEITVLLWAMAKLVEYGQERTPELKEAVAALLPKVKAQKDKFIPQHIANLLWAMAKLVEYGQEQTPKFKEAVAALLPRVKAQKDQFIPQHIANMLWAVGKLGEFVDLNLVKSTLDSLVHAISEIPQLSQQETLVSLWGVMACSARLYLDSNAKKDDLLENLIDDLFTHLENKSLESTEDQHTIAMAASWLGRVCPVAPNYETTISNSQSIFRHQLQSRIPSLKIEEEKSLNTLPPVDLFLPDHNIVIEVMGPYHYVGGGFQTRNGSTLLKIALLQKLGLKVIEIPVNKLANKDAMERVINQIKTMVNIPPEVHGSISLKNREADEAYVTADEGWQSSDDCYLTAEEYLEEQTGKSKKRKRKRNRKKKRATSSLPL